MPELTLAQELTLAESAIGHYGPTLEEAQSEEMAAFKEAALSEEMYEAVKPQDMFAAECGDGRGDEKGNRFGRGYFYFGGGFAPFLGEALAFPDLVIKNKWDLAEHSYVRSHQLRERNPERIFVAHNIGEEALGCGLLAGREVVYDRIENELADFADFGRGVGLIAHKDPEITKRFQKNSARLLDSGYFSVSNKELRELVTQPHAHEEKLVGAHGEWIFVVNHRPYTRLRTMELTEKFGGPEAFTVDHGNAQIDTAELATVVTGGVDEALSKHYAAQCAEGMGIMATAGIATLGNKYLAGLARY